MASYSHSKVSCFETCPYQYKLKYIDRAEVDFPTTIESFLGDIVHRTLEKLYHNKKWGKDISKESLMKIYKKIWQREFSEDILISKKELSSENYKKMGGKFIESYYERMKPFDQMKILGLETQDRMTLPDGNQWHVRIDKLGCDDKGNYFICDYKTNSKMKFQEEADSDRQLAMYSIWVKDKFKDAKSVKLVWHMLAFDKEVISERTDEQLKKLQKEIMDSIKKIQKAEEKNNFPTNVTALCDYCSYKSMCPSFKHLKEIEEKNITEFKEDEGVQFVDEFAEVSNKLKELEEKQNKLKNKILSFAKQRGVNIVYGSNMRCSVREFDRIVLPEGKEKYNLIKLMKDKGVYEDCSMICYPRLNTKFFKNEIEQDIKNFFSIKKEYRLFLGKKREELE